MANCNTHSQNDWQPFGKITTPRKLENIQKTTLLVTGEKDIPFNLRMADYMLAMVRSATRLMLRNAAHMVNLDKPDVFNKKVLDFLKLY